MSKVILDAATLAKLGGLTEVAELYDERGRLLARCLPAGGPPCPFTDEEIEAAFDTTDPGQPLTEVLAELRKL